MLSVNPQFLAEDIRNALDEVFDDHGLCGERTRFGGAERTGRTWRFNGVCFFGGIISVGGSCCGAATGRTGASLPAQSSAWATACVTRGSQGSLNRCPKAVATLTEVWPPEPPKSPDAQ